MTASKLRTLWEEGADDEGKQAPLLMNLNATLDEDVKLSCTANVWTYGNKNKEHQYQANVNIAELL